jgi:very-short-patch-repair endonuclease
MFCNRENLKQCAQTLRLNMNFLWARIRRKQMLGLQVFRKKPIGFYIADFCIPKAKLVIEVDGAHHMDETHHENDIVRDESMSGRGLKVLRFTNKEVLRETDKVIKVIYSQIIE